MEFSWKLAAVFGITAVLLSIASLELGLTGMAVHQTYTGFAQPLASYTLSTRNVSFATAAEQETLSVSVTDQAVYRYAYVSLDGSDWMPFPLSGSLLGGAWFNGTVTGQVSFNASSFGLSQARLSTRRNFIVVYTCTKIGGVWNCNDGWQIWQFNASLAYQCVPDCSCASSTCTGSTCPNGCGGTCPGTLSPDCGARVCGPAPNGCGTSTQCGTCSPGVCVSGQCVTSDLMLHYTFDSVSGGIVQDQSPYDNDGTVHGNPQITVAGLFGNGMRFDGVGDYLDAGTFTPTGQGLTISAWFKMDTLPATFDPRIISKAESLNLQDWELQVNHLSGGFTEFRVRLQGETDMVASRVYDNTRTIETGNWYHVAGVFDGAAGTGKLYMNCEEIASRTRTGSLIATSSSVWIGDTPPSGGRPFTGTIDDVRVYNRALSPQEIVTLYSQCPTCSPCGNLLATLPPPPPAA